MDTDHLDGTMNKIYDLVIKGGTVWTTSGPSETDVAVKNGIISEIGSISSTSAGDVFDATGLMVLPGVVDTQVHVRLPGNDQRENPESGCRAAV